jgi:L-alanine-DL-glutamate epimerase-like enolase superfamily enzyme
MIPIEHIETRVYTIPTDSLESDGTFEWSKTTMVLVNVTAGNQTGMGFTYSHGAAAELIRENFIPILEGRNSFDVPALFQAMARDVRNLGRPGLASAAISAVDMALWDLKAKLMNLPLYQLWGRARECVEVYGSGGFISYSEEQLLKQLGDWRQQGINKFKIKIGHNEQEDLKRIRQARQIIGPSSGLFVDANGAYTSKQALGLSRYFSEFGVKWFEEPVSSDDLEGLRFLRERVPPAMDIAAGEYGYDIDYYRRMLQAMAVDVLQADVTRCGGFTVFFQVAALARAFHVPLSSHAAPALHFHACLCIDQVCHMEYFHDHVRIEKLFFEGGPVLNGGKLYPNLPYRSGLGLQLKDKEVEKYLIRGADYAETYGEKTVGHT